MKRNIFSWGGMWLGVLLLLSLTERVPAVILNLQDGNSTVAIDASSQHGLFNWLIDGVNLAPTFGGGISDYRQWFWYRVGATPEQSIDALTLSFAGTTDANFDGFQDTAFVRYLGAGFKIEVKFSLNGGSPGSGSADIGEQINIVNTGTSPLDMHFFQYGDFMLNPPSVGGETVVFSNTNTVHESGANGDMQETVHTPPASHQEAEPFATTINKLNDGVASNLVDNSGAGPGDITWAYQWDSSITGGDTFPISKDMLATVPEPGTATLVVGGLLALLALGRRRS